jgi:hypothetical protein
MLEVLRSIAAKHEVLIMAQWLGQFTGNTHKTKVLDAQALLEHAVEVFKNAGPAERFEKAKAVCRLAKRLHDARQRFLKARTKALTRPNVDPQGPVESREVEKLRAALSDLVYGGISQILDEFAARDALQ